MFLLGEKPLLIDEWQMYPVVWDAIRNDVDRSGKFGEYIITGSARPSYDAVMHSGTGRIASLLMRPMSLYESLESTGKVSLKDLFSGNAKVSDSNNLKFNDIVNYIIRGGWPQAVTSNALSGNIAKNYIEKLSKEGLYENGDVRYNPDRLKRILHSISRNISSPINVSTIYDDILSNDESISRTTLDNYIDLLKKLYIIDNVPAWNGKLRSKFAIRTKEKLELVDPSLAVASLGSNYETLVNDLNTLGLLFENLCIRDLKIYAESLGGTVSYYRDETNLECDAIVELQNGDWGAVEIKLGGNSVETASNNLLKIRDRVDTDKLGEPKFLMVLTGEQMSYQLDNGVYIVSIGSLKN